MIPVLTRDAERKSELSSSLHVLSSFRDRCCPTSSFGITSTDKLLIGRSHYHNAVIPKLSCDVNVLLSYFHAAQSSSDVVIVTCSNFTAPHCCHADYLSEHLSGRMQMSGSDAEEECRVSDTSNIG